MLRLAVIKLTSCSGCLNQLLSVLLSNGDIRAKFQIALFEEIGIADTPPYELAFVEGSVSNTDQERKVKDIRSKCKMLVALGTCAIQGGVQALRAGENIEEAKKTVYPEPGVIEVYSEPKSLYDVVEVDYAIHGCPISSTHITSLLRKLAIGGLPITLYESVCSECKRKYLECVMVTRGIPCLGPLTLSTCGALCPENGRGCYGCTGLRVYDIDREKLKVVKTRLSVLGLSYEEVNTLLKAFSTKSMELISTKGSKY